MNKDLKNAIIAFAVAAIALFVCNQTANAVEFDAGRTDAGQTFVKISGEIFEGDDVLVKKHLNKYRPHYIYLDSVGGDVNAGWAIAKIIRDLNIETVVGENASCASACTFAFAGGIKRWVHSSADLGYHPASVADWGKYTQDQAYEYGQETAISTALQYAFYSKAGSEYSVIKFINKVYQTVDADTMYWADHAELLHASLATDLF